MSPNELSELAPIAATLNKESNEINETIASLNDSIASLNLGIEVWCGPWNGEDHCQIGFAKVQDGSSERWQLAIRSCTPVCKLNDFGGEYWEAEPGSLEWAQPLLKAPRKFRIEGLSKVPDILVALKYEAERAIEAIRAGKALASELTSSGKGE